jgi:hypothetical protein
MRRKKYERSGRGMSQGTLQQEICTSQTNHHLPFNSANNLCEVLQKFRRTRHDFCNFTVREEHRLRVNDNRVQKSTFGPKRDDWKGLVDVAQ